MIQTYSPTIRRKEMEAVLTCMVDEKIGPGELNVRLIQTIKELTGCDGAVALRSPALALQYALQASAVPAGSGIMKMLAAKKQILCITHLASIAVYADTQIKIQKGVEGNSTSTQVFPVTAQARVQEIARMLSGDPTSSESLEHAASMLQKFGGK